MTIDELRLTSYEWPCRLTQSGMGLRQTIILFPGSDFAGCSGQATSFLNPYTFQLFRFSGYKVQITIKAITR